MIPLTEAELFAMREVQAKATPAPWFQIYPTSCCVRESEKKSHVGCIFRAEDRLFAIQARTDWLRVTEWAVKALDALRNRVRQGHHEFCLSRKFSLCHCGYAEARRLLGDP